MSVGGGQSCSPRAVAPLLAPVLGSLAGVTDPRSSERCSETQHTQDLAQADKSLRAVLCRQLLPPWMDKPHFWGSRATTDRHVEPFQGLETFHEPGLPTQLPAAIEESLEHVPGRSVQACWSCCLDF
jgi:hypothetical protein